MHTERQPALTPCYALAALYPQVTVVVACKDGALFKDCSVFDVTSKNLSITAHIESKPLGAPDARYQRVGKKGVRVERK